ncbi:UNVERIFIED_CONTAM: Sestrin-1 [Trichonephila clavipes]
MEHIALKVAQETVEELMEKMTLLQKKEKESSGEEQKNGNTSDLPSALDAQFECDMEKFIDDDITFTRRAFSIADGHISDFIIQDCTWDDHAYSLLNRFYNDVGTILDEKFKVAYDLTYYTMGHKENVDTTIFRRAVWNYIHRIYGIIHDDYNYSEMEGLLDYGFRSYVETVCFCPEKITKDAHDEIMRAFRHSEKAAARHQCTCLINHHKQKFVAQGGNIQWLKGLQYIPKKLMNLNEINKILAHTPWLLKKSHIEKLTKGKDNWSIGELCQAVVLLAHFHCLCSFVFASEILEHPEECQDTGNNNTVTENESSVEVCFHLSRYFCEAIHLRGSNFTTFSNEQRCFVKF